MRAMATRMELMLQMSERETVPGFALEASLFENQPLLQDGTMAMREPFGEVARAGDGAGTPLRPFSGRTAGYVRETRERLAALRDEIRAEEQATVARVREAVFGLDLARRREHAAAFVLGGVGVSFAGGLVLSSGLSLSEQFNQNDLYHVIQALGLRRGRLCGHSRLPAPRPPAHPDRGRHRRHPPRH